jgi:mannose-6-phosphate isomerase class I
VVLPDGETPLDAWLGEEQLPYLLKLLSASRALSIQVHPNPAQAKRGFQREEALRIPRDARTRSYRDPAAKPELFVALTPFSALIGLRPVDEVVDLLESLPEIAAVVPTPSRSHDAITTWLGAWLSAPPERRHAALSGVAEHLHTLNCPSESIFRRIVADSPAALADPGLLFVLLMRTVHLAPGEAVFLPAGCMHAYIEGTGIEVMACSDNVVRAGLTSKHIDIPEFLSIVDLAQPPPPVLGGTPSADRRERVYCTPADAFQLSVLQLSASPLERRCIGRETLLNVDDARARIETQHGALFLHPGQACVLPNGCVYTATSHQSTRLYRVSTPSSGAADAITHSSSTLSDRGTHTESA